MNIDQKQKPVVIVAVVLCAVIVLPFVLWALSKMVSGAGGDSAGSSDLSGGAGAAIDYEFHQLADRAAQLMETDLARAVREGDISVDEIAEFERLLGQAQSDAGRGKLTRAKARFEALIQRGEARLSEIALADRAREMKVQTYEALERLGKYRKAFEHTYLEAVASYDKAISELGLGAYQESIDGFELSQAILGDLEARAIQQLATLMEQAERALSEFDLVTSEAAFRKVLEIDPGNLDAEEGLGMIAALDGIEDRIREITDLADEGRVGDALKMLELLGEEHPENRFVEMLRERLVQREIELKFEALVAESYRLEDLGEIDAAITALEEALLVQEDQEQANRLVELQARDKAMRLETLLADGFEALKLGQYETARDLYKEAVSMAPESNEARTGLERASSLYLAFVRYSQHLKGVDSQIADGRFPIAAKLFNQAMRSRPSVLPTEFLQREEKIRGQLEAQSREVPIVITSDRRTYVSVIDVLPPDRFKTMDLKLFPDVYKVRGTRKGYQSVEMEIKVDAMKSGEVFHIQCKERL